MIIAGKNVNAFFQGIHTVLCRDSLCFLPGNFKQNAFRHFCFVPRRKACTFRKFFSPIFLRRRCRVADFPPTNLISGLICLWFKFALSLIPARLSCRACGSALPPSFVRIEWQDLRGVTLVVQVVGIRTCIEQHFDNFRSHFWYKRSRVKGSPQSVSCRFTSDPAFNRTFTTAVCRAATAVCNGVFPSSFKA